MPDTCPEESLPHPSTVPEHDLRDPISWNLPFIQHVYNWYIVLKPFLESHPSPRPALLDLNHCPGLAPRAFPRIHAQFALNPRNEQQIYRRPGMLSLPAHSRSTRPIPKLTV
uniref:Uncharacterized protein n=1 Tax=Physcomitrium patens TaxID=3218 RepID=A0A2K1L0B8_PHYPA|nr:hypothetical protein PHYPA_002261 [Physcomitrium patens]